jgi:hypothetical protein
VIYVFGASIAALVVVYMARPNFRRMVTSAAVFFRDDPAAASATRFGWSPPRPTPLFYAQLTVLLLLLLAVPQCQVLLRSGPQSPFGLWVIVDRSASMSTVQEDRSRMQLAVAQLENLLSKRWERGYCVRLSTFDMELRDVRGDLRSVADVMKEASTLSPRALGTDVALVERALKQPRREVSDQCRIDNAVVMTDMPAPAWMDDAAARGDVWVDVSQPTGNLGLTDISETRDQFTGKVERVQVRIEAFGEIPKDARLTLALPGGAQKIRPVQPWIGSAAVVELKPDAPGTYSIELSPGGAYRFDDRAAIDVPAANGLRVDWRVGQRDWLRRLGWNDASDNPDLRVLSAGTMLDDRPAILVGPGYAPTTTVQPIADFFEASPLLNALNLDVAERAGMRPAPTLPASFQPVLRGRGGAVWVAQRQDPPAVYVPGLPLDGDGSLPRFSSTVFFNAARWILQRRPLQQLFTLTSPDQPEPAGSRIALHPAEGNTTRTPRSVGSLDRSVRRAATNDPQPRAVWPWFVAAAAAIFLLERWLGLAEGIP